MSRHTKAYQEWRLAVLEKDNYQCQNCLSKEKIIAHHIVLWNHSEELRCLLRKGKSWKIDPETNKRFWVD